MSYRSVILKDSPAFLWPLDDVSGDTFREVIAGKHATRTAGSPTRRVLTSAGIYGLDFDGSTRLSAGDDAAFTLTTFTFEFIFRCDGAVPASSSSIISKWGTGGGTLEYAINVGQGENIQTYIGRSGVNNYYRYRVAPDGSFLPNTTYHFASTYDGSSHIKHWLNGVELGDHGSFPPFGPTGSQQGDSAQPLIIGNYDGSSVPFIGVLAMLTVYTTALSQATILRHLRELRRTGVSL